MRSDGPHQVDSVDGWNNGVGTTYDPFPEEARGGTASVVGLEVDGIEEVGLSLANAYATHDLTPGALGALLGGLVAIARGPFGVASQHALQSLQNAHKAVSGR